MGIEEKVKNNIIKDKLFRKGERILVGVSGGADSVCLIHILNRLKDELKIKLYIAHLDHGLRNDSRKDAEFVKDLAKNLNIPVAIKRVQIKRIRGNLSIEEAARNTRLDFLLKEAVKAGAKKVALAHNFDDQAETVLMRILRGTGLYGLSAMASKRKANNLFLIRPLLNIKRGEIEAFLKKNNVAFRTDKSNTQEIYLRNRIRLELLPCLEKKYNKNIKEALFSLAKCASSDYDYLNIASQRLYFGNKLNPELKKLARLHPAILRLKLRESISALQGDTRRVTFRHIQELEDLLFNRPLGSIVDLPKGLSVLKKQKNFVFYLR